MGTTFGTGVPAGDDLLREDGVEAAELGVDTRRRRRAGEGVAERIPALLGEK